MMIINQTQNINISKFEIAVDFFKSAFIDAAESLLNKITISVESQNKRLRTNHTLYEENPHLLLDDKMILEYERIDDATDVYEILLKEVEEYKDKSPAFMKLYKAIDTYYTSLVVVPTDLGFIEANLKHEQRRLKNAS